MAYNQKGKFVPETPENGPDEYRQKTSFPYEGYEQQHGITQKAFDLQNPVG